VSQKYRVTASVTAPGDSNVSDATGQLGNYQCLSGARAVTTIMHSAYHK